MTAVLRWLSPDPVATAARLRGHLDAVAAARAARGRTDRPEGDLRIELDRLTIEVVRAPDRPNGAPADERLELARGQSGSPPRSRSAPRDLRGSTASFGGLPRLVALGWATVEIERFAADLGRPATRLPDDVILGAFAANVAGDPPLVLLEPETEGRLVASLAHWGEGPVALYLAGGTDSGGLHGAAARLRTGGFSASAVAAGPFGPEFAILGGPVRGPHLLVCDPPAPPAAGPRRPA